MSVGTRHTELNALFGFAERQLHVVKRYWAWEIVWLFYSLVSVLSIGFLASGLGSLGVGSGSFDLRRAQLYLFIVAAFMFNLDLSHANVAGALGVLVASTLPLIGLSILTAVLPLLSPQKGE